MTTAEAIQVNVTARVQVGAASSIKTAEKKFTAALEEYFYKIAYDELTTDFTPARCGYLLLDTAGIFDYTDLKLNGSTRTITIGPEQVFQVGRISLTAR